MENQNLQTKPNLSNSQTKSGIETLQSKAMAYLAVAFDRTNTEPFNVEKMSFDIITEFPELSDEDLKKAIKNGGLGKYGKTYKLSTQEVCIWIREYIKENEIKIGKISLENFQKSSKYNGEY